MDTALTVITVSLSGRGRQRILYKSENVKNVPYSPSVRIVVANRPEENGGALLLWYFATFCLNRLPDCFLFATNIRQL